jgi:hypothetical protein
MRLRLLRHLVGLVALGPPYNVAQRQKLIGPVTVRTLPPRADSPRRGSEIQVVCRKDS